jgi:hypothetical protein
MNTAAADDKSADEDKKLALKYCDHICQNWPKSDLYPTAELLAAGILLNHTDNAVKATAMPRLEKAADAGMALNSKAGRATTANALFWLASYAAEYPAEGETEEAAQARARGYGERFWKDGDAEGDPFVLPMVAVGLNSITTKEHFDVEIPRAQKIIAREANYMFKNNKADAELEKTINTYVDSYVNGNKTYNDKTMTLEEKTAHFTSFPGIDPADIDHIFDRFYKGRQGKYGLGLSIVNAIVVAHEGTVRARNRSSDGDGTGAIFEILLPPCKRSRSLPE